MNGKKAPNQQIKEAMISQLLLNIRKQKQAFRQTGNRRFFQSGNKYLGFDLADKLKHNAFVQ